MPRPADILAGLTRIANDLVPLAVGWHVAIAALLGALGLGWRPGTRWLALAATAPIASAAIVGAAYGNPFNAVVLGAGSVALAVAGWRAGAAPIEPASRPLVAIGLATVAFGWLYPHFLAPETPLSLRAIGAPTGLVPCPSLAVTLGIAIGTGGFRSRAWSAIAASLGLFYAVFGVARLGVWLDVPLGLAALVVASRLGRRGPAATTTAPPA